MSVFLHFLINEEQDTASHLRYKSYYWDVKSGWKERRIYAVYEEVKCVNLIVVGNLVIDDIEKRSGTARCPVHGEEGSGIHLLLKCTEMHEWGGKCVNG